MSRKDRTGTSQAAKPIPSRAPTHDNGIIPPPKSPVKQDKKNLTNSDPPSTVKRSGKSGGAGLQAKPKSADNPDSNPRATTQTPALSNKSAVVSRSDVQYIASSVAYPFIRTDIILAGTIDEAEKINGLRIYDDMLLDPTVAGVRLWSLVNTLADGLTVEAAEFEPPIGSEEIDPVDQKEAEWSRRYIKAVIKRLSRTDRDIFGVMWDLLDGARLPHVIAEVNFDTFKTGEYSGLYFWDSIRPKPRPNYNLIYDEMNTFRGVLGLVPGGSIAKWSGIITDASKLPNVVSPEKLIFFFADDRLGIPKSLWNGIYAPWARLQGLYTDMMETSQGATGGKIAVTLGDKAGQKFTDPTTGEEVTAEMATFNQARQWRNNGVLVLQNGSTPYVFYPQGDALDSFVEAIKMTKAEIAIGLTTNAKSILEGEHSSGLSEDNASDDAEPVIDLLKMRLCLCLDKLFYSTLKLSRGEAYAERYAPTASMKKGDKVDFPPAGTTLSQLVAADALTPSQMPDAAKIVGLKAPTSQEMDLLTQSWQARIGAAIDAALNPPEPASENAPPKAGKTSTKARTAK
jgi:hypothetical protein